MLSSNHALDTGRIHTLESFSAVDGPGIRAMVFLQGCHLGCPYCHNKDTWSHTGGTEMTVTAVMDFIEGYRSFFELSGGGVTFSGGEPLLQGPFLLSLLKACREKGIHTALETSGHGIELCDDAKISAKALAKEIIEQVDLVILDVKRPGQPLEAAPVFIRQLAKSHQPVWLRYVELPSPLTAPERVATFGKSFSGLERIEPLAYHELLGTCSCATFIEV